jgi:uncharacterized protein YegL
LPQGCDSNGADIIFVLDSSGSITSPNFNKMKAFVQAVVSSLDVGMGPRQNRIGLIQFSDSAQTEFYLNSYSNASAINNAIGNIPYLSRGTKTNLALDLLISSGFTVANGARPQRFGHPWIGVVLTDGQSNDPALTAISAKKVHDADITMIAVGIGNSVNEQELDIIASSPVCLHVILLSDFTEVASLNYIIEQRTCDAPVIATPSQNFTISVDLPAGGDQNCQIKVPAEGGTVQITSLTAGVSYFYMSKSTYPGENYYEDKVQTTSAKAGFIYISVDMTFNSTGVMFCNVQGDITIPSNITLGVDNGDTVPSGATRTCLTLLTMLLATIGVML